MSITAQVIKRLLDSPMAKQAEREIVSERESQSRELQVQLAKLRAERTAAINDADPKYAAAKREYDAAEQAVRNARKELEGAHRALSRARNMHHSAIREIESQIAELEVAQS